MYSTARGSQISGSIHCHLPLTRFTFSQALSLRLLEEPSPLRSGGQQGLLLHLDRLREVFPGGLEVTHGILRLAEKMLGFHHGESHASSHRVPEFRASVQKKPSDTALLAGLGSQNWVH